MTKLCTPSSIGKSKIYLELLKDSNLHFSQRKSPDSRKESMSTCKPLARKAIENHYPSRLSKIMEWQSFNAGLLDETVGNPTSLILYNSVR